MAKTRDINRGIRRGGEEQHLSNHLNGEEIGAPTKPENTAAYLNKVADPQQDFRDGLNEFPPKPQTFFQA